MTGKKWKRAAGSLTAVLSAVFLSACGDNLKTSLPMTKNIGGHTGKEEKEQEIKRIDRKEREMQERQERREKIANAQTDENISTPTVKPKRNRVSKPIDAYEFEYDETDGEEDYQD